ncbi:hypothetical protein PLESTB_000739000 [Pleodorina starrii]|uniref:Uncharacterized protein n=1 Tax=Pleodorina starrii TaxID=330485 RepID=A0A9W6F2I1_9CHLO|nr:hypothetical protein PLESTB_000739000 [Pleodorina starrii]GLC67145.1 hypothetical protein PLESTF_000522100 [Pleodorina starrii]
MDARTGAPAAAAAAVLRCFLPPRISGADWVKRNGVGGAWPWQCVAAARPASTAVAAAVAAAAAAAAAAVAAAVAAASTMRPLVSSCPGAHSCVGPCALEAAAAKTGDGRVYGVNLCSVCRGRRVIRLRRVEGGREGSQGAGACKWLEY